METRPVPLSMHILKNRFARSELVTESL
jgi:hypothetical protein